MFSLNCYKKKTIAPLLCERHLKPPVLEGVRKGDELKNTYPISGDAALTSLQSVTPFLQKKGPYQTCKICCFSKRIWNFNFM